MPKAKKKVNKKKTTKAKKNLLEMTKEKFDYFMARIAAI
jgi:hypothetical protein